MHAQDAIDLIVTRIGGLVDQVLGSNYDAGSAETALQPPCCDEAVGEGVTLKLAEAFKRQHCLSRGALRGHGPRNKRFAVDDYRATSTLTLRAAAVLWRDQPAGVAQDFEKRHSVFNLDSSLGCVQAELDSVSHGLLPRRANGGNDLA